MAPGCPGAVAAPGARVPPLVTTGGAADARLIADKDATDDDLPLRDGGPLAQALPADMRE